MDPSRRPLKIMWSTTGAVPPVGPVQINHFVPLLLKCADVCADRPTAAKLIKVVASDDDDFVEPLEETKDMQTVEDKGCKRVLQVSTSDEEEQV